MKKLWRRLFKKINTLTLTSWRWTDAEPWAEFLSRYVHVPLASDELLRKWEGFWAPSILSFADAGQELRDRTFQCLQKRHKARIYPCTWYRWLTFRARSIVTTSEFAHFARPHYPIILTSNLEMIFSSGKKPMLLYTRTESEWYSISIFFGHETKERNAEKLAWYGTSAFVSMYKTCLCKQI